MFPPNNSHLSILRPSPTTVSFTVSTRSSYQSLPYQVLYYIVLGLRFLVLASTFAMLASKFIDPVPPFLETLVVRLALIPWSYLAPAASVILFVVFRRFYTEESLLTLSTLGIQISSRSPCYLLPATVRFIPTSSIRDIFIHEAFRGFEVRYYLAVVVEGEGGVVVVFPKLLPGREIVEEVWRGARECLYGPKE